MTTTSAQAAPPPHETYATRFGLRPVALGRRGMVATANPLATLAGLRMFARGGNAVDALVAAAAAIGVVEPYMSDLAGCGVLVLTRPGHRPRVLNFLGRASSGATSERLRGATRGTEASRRSSATSRLSAGSPRIPRSICSRASPTAAGRRTCASCCSLPTTTPTTWASWSCCAVP